jgi:archaemetzincin
MAAIGPVQDLPRHLQRALRPDDFFRPVPTPNANDWLTNHPEEGQTFDQFVRSRPNRPDDVRNVIYLQPLGRFEPEDSPPLSALVEFGESFFMMRVAMAPPLDIAQARITTRHNPYTGHIQLLTTDILEVLRRNLPPDAFAVLGVTMFDLYPHPAWNFVFGQASLRQRVGVYSFARYDPRFYGEQLHENRRELLLRRSCKVLAHEAGHMFGIAHCVFFHCLMNGSNHLEESDARPMHECPVDLRKLHYSIGFDVVARYQRLLDFCRRVGFEDEARWLERRIAFILADD